MERKNTMLLTVIAVATLLVAVVGATFAYYGIIGNNTSSSTALTGNTGLEVGLVTLNNEKTALKLYVTDEDMAQAHVGTRYHAVDDTASANTKGTNGAAPYSAGSYYTASSTNVYNPISRVTVTGGDAATKYQCVSTVTVRFNGQAAAAKVTDQEDRDIFQNLVTGDARVTFKIDNNNAVVLDRDGFVSTDGTDYVTVNATANHEKDIKDFYGSANNHEVTYRLQYRLTGAGAYTLISADVELDNTQYGQSQISGATLGATITNTEFSCDIVDNWTESFNALGQTSTAPARPVTP